MDQFSYSHSVKFTERQYVEIISLFARQSRYINSAIALAGGIVCLFSAYTVILGVIILVVLVLSLTMPNRIPGTLSKVYQNSRLLKDEVRYGVDNNGLELNCRLLDAKAPWEAVVVWKEQGDWLQIQSEGMPACWFKVSNLRAACVYDDVIKRCKNAVQ